MCDFNDFFFLCLFVVCSDQLRTQLQSQSAQFHAERQSLKRERDATSAQLTAVQKELKQMAADYASLNQRKAELESELEKTKKELQQMHTQSE